MVPDGVGMTAIPGRGWLLANVAANTLGVQGAKDRTRVINQWCEEQFGPCGNRWYVDDHVIHYTWRFRHEEDRMLFMLTWG